MKAVRCASAHPSAAQLALLLASLTLTLSSCARTQASSSTGAAVLPAQELTLFVTANLRGYLAPCGCSENMRGGIARAAAQLEAVRREGRPVLFVDGGNTLFAHSHLQEPEAPGAQRKASALAEALRRMGLALHASTPVDEAAGGPFREGLGLPHLPEGRAEVVTSDGRRLGVVSASTLEQLETGAREAKRRGAQWTLGIVHQSLQRALELTQQTRTKESPVDLLVAVADDDGADVEENRLIEAPFAQAPLPVLQLQSKGRSLLRVDLHFGSAGAATGATDGGPAESQRLGFLRGPEVRTRELSALEERIELLRRQVNEPSLKPDALAMRRAKLDELLLRREALAAQPLPEPAHGAAHFSARFVPLETTLPMDASVKAIVAAYDASVGELNLAWAKAHGRDCPPAAKGKAAFVGNERCAECHEESFGVYLRSKHSRAYTTLLEVGKQHHLECVGCHVTGSNAPGGVCRIDKVAGRERVGCESCHGPGSLHSDDPSADNIVNRFEPKQCTGCHDKENSPHFDFPRYLREVLGPGHGGGKPAAR